MKTTTILSTLALASASLAAPAANKRDTTTTTSTTVTLVADAPGTAFHASAINANDLTFWIGLKTTTGCYVNPQLSYECGQYSNETSVIISSSGSAVMNAGVPGPQIVYVNTTQHNDLAYSEAHTEQTYGGATTAFTRDANDHLALNGNDEWQACFNVARNAYQILSVADGLAGVSCKPTKILAVTNPDVEGRIAAYQYI